MKNTSLFLFVFGVFVVFLAVGGWVMNIIKIFRLVPGEITTEFVLRVVDIMAAPFGAIMGYL